MNRSVFNRFPYSSVMHTFTKITHKAVYDKAHSYFSASKRGTVNCTEVDEKRLDRQVKKLKCQKEL